MVKVILIHQAGLFLIPNDAYATLSKQKRSLFGERLCLMRNRYFICQYLLARAHAQQVVAWW